MFFSFFFFFKQKTAYEFRISDWSSDVCSSDLQHIRLPIPDLTEERRKELAKLAGQYAEKARIAVRNVRRDGMDSLKTDEKKHEISEDEHKRLGTEVQKMTDDTIAEIDAATSAKEKEILQT